MTTLRELIENHPEWADLPLAFEDVEYGETRINTFVVIKSEMIHGEEVLLLGYDYTKDSP